MNSDDLMSDFMSDPAVPTPSDSTKGAVTPAWNSKKFREEYDLYKRRLQDQKFSVADYPDPLAPRPPHPKQYPKGTDPELERRLHALIADVKASLAAEGNRRGA
ncbi:hypothetical protein NEMBOFW57_002985 [Staphylotrichum longicolle]|uniref:Uncharacterized protein n=1 Tax=Staphylotrichum longicolle TaxID=669026 RepID=A0AAD4F5C3_9PEZI|nr:hypothetical protein NEMBOFW57_002985 [Staphylotrichum longicolle]